MCREPGRRGQSLVEVLVALLLLAALATACVGLLTVQLRQVRTVAALVESGGAARFGSRLLRTELRLLVPARDLEAMGPDSSRQRVFRGMGVICAATGTTVEIRYRGLRDPDPAKDSVLVISAAGESAFRLVAVGTPMAPSCNAGAGEQVYELTAGSPVATSGILLLFERGTWHLSGSALRYARPAGGRQPITAAVLFDDSTDIAVASGTGAPTAFQLTLAATVSGRPGPRGLLRESVRVALLNLAVPLDSVVLTP